MIIGNKPITIVKNCNIVRNINKNYNDNDKIKECIFCENPKDVVLSTDNFYVKVGKAIISEGHVMIVSKKHLKAIGSIPIEFLEEFEDLKKKLIEFITKNYYKPVIIENGGTFQSVLHAHMHFVSMKIDGHKEVNFVKDVVLSNLKKYNIDFINVNDFKDVINLYKQDGEYLYFEENDIKIAVRTKTIKNEDVRELMRTEKLNYRYTFYKVYNDKSILSWKNMTEDAEKEDIRKIENTKKTFKNL